MLFFLSKIWIIFSTDFAHYWKFSPIFETTKLKKPKPCSQHTSTTCCSAYYLSLLVWQKVWLHGSKQNQSCLKIHDTYLLLGTSLLIP
jgi:hypothetical protein